MSTMRTSLMVLYRRSVMERWSDDCTEFKLAIVILHVVYYNTCFVLTVDTTSTFIFGINIWSLIFEFEY